MVYSLLRPLLHRLDPELAHSLSLAALRLTGAVAPLRSAVRSALAPATARPVRAFGLSFPNPVGLAAGYDKDGLAWRGLVCLGFGHLELGTVTPRPQPGNPKPRIFRLGDDRSLINRLGFPSRGADFLARRLRERPAGGGMIGVNLGKQKATPLESAADDYELLMSRFAPLADYLVVNVSSPNTPELRRLQESDWLDPLLQRLARRKQALEQELGRRVPLLIKLSPDPSDEELSRTLETIRRRRLDGVVATNTTVARDGLRSSARLAAQAGGLSGAALRERSTDLVRKIAAQSAGALPIIACGGVASAEDARAKLEAGATLVQLYTGLVFEGPGLVRRIVEDLAR